MGRHVRSVHRQFEFGRWEMAVAQAHPALRDYVREYVGGSEDVHYPVCRRELPTEIAPVIINFGAPFRMFDQADPNRYVELRSFATGAFDTYALVGATGAYACVQINFTLLGARLFLQQPLKLLTNREVPLDDVLGRPGRELESELHDAPSWAARFDILDRVILSRVTQPCPVPDAIVHSWKQLMRTAGQTNIAALAHQTGWSHKHFIAQFTEHMGLPPKAIARVLRFARAADLLKMSDRGRLTEIAHACGYYDHAHFTRDFRAFAGVTPTDLLASQLPEGAGFTA